MCAAATKGYEKDYDARIADASRRERIALMF